MTSNPATNTAFAGTALSNTTNKARQTVQAEDGNRGERTTEKDPDVCKNRSENVETENHHSKTCSSDRPRPLDIQAIAPISLNKATALDSALALLATATPEKLAGIFAVLIFTTYLILGRLGLILIGTILGVVLHASWEGGGLEARKRQSEGSVELAGRLLDWDPRDKKPIQSNGTSDGCADYYSELPPLITAALASLTDGVIEAHIKRWYDNMLPHEPTFPNACRGSLTHLVNGISVNLSRRKPTDIFIQFLTNVSSILIVFLGEISAAIHLQQHSQPQSLDESKDPSGSSKPTSTAEAIHAYLAQYPESSLASVISTSQQNKKLHTVAQDFLQTFVESNITRCEPIMTLLRQIFAGVILENVLNKTTKADYINNWIIYLLEAGETDLMHAIDAGVDGGDKRNGRRTNPSRQTQTDLRNSPHTRKEGGKKKKQPHLSRSDMDMEEAMEEVRQLNAMIAAAEAEAAAEATSNGETAFPSADLGDGGHMERIKATAAINDKRGSEETDPTKSSDLEKPSSVGRKSLPADLGDTVSLDGKKDKDKSLPEPSVSPPSTNATMKYRSASTPLRSHNRETSLTSKTPTTNTNGSHDATPLQAPSPQPQRRSFDQPSSKFLNASVTLMDDSLPNDRTKLRFKPTQDYLLQIETRPDAAANSPASGYVITRRYADFEALHETLKRIASISGYTEFTLKHNDLPFWKGRSGNELREALERYLNDALKYIGLADCEKMKKYLEKDASVAKTKTKFNGFSTPKNDKSRGHSNKGNAPGSGGGGSGSSSGNLFENMGKGMLEVLSHAPKDVTKGGKTVLDNVTSAFQTNTNSNGNYNSNAIANGSGSGGRNDNGVNSNKHSNGSENGIDNAKQIRNLDDDFPPTPFSQTQTPTRTVTDKASDADTTSNRPRTQSTASSSKNTLPGEDPVSAHTVPRGRLSVQLQRSLSTSSSLSASPSSPAKRSAEPSRLSLQFPVRNPSSVTSERGVTHPSGSSDRSPEGLKENDSVIQEERVMVDIPTNSGPDGETQGESHDTEETLVSRTTSRSSTDGESTAAPERHERKAQPTPAVNDRTSSDSLTLSNEETSIAIELLFAIINETYTLSSAWSLRKKLLTAAKSLLLRSGNPGAEAMRVYLQERILRANASQEAIIGHIGGLKRAATGPGGSHFPRITSAKDREELRNRARRIFVTRGMPQALMGVMGSSATEEALGRIFDCLQMEEVARGLMFTIMLQGLKTIIM